MEVYYQEILMGISGIESSSMFQHRALFRELLSPCERTLLDRVYEIGKDYTDLKKLVDEVGIDGGVYRQALAEQVHNCLGPYKKQILNLETSSPSLSKLYGKLYPYSEIIKGLTSLVKEISISQKRGTDLIDLIGKHISRPRALHVAIKMIYKSISKLMLNQLQIWLLFGDLFDSKNEFFIKKTTQSDDSNPFETYSLQSSLLPSYIPPLIGEMILNVGQTVLFLRHRSDITDFSTDGEFQIDNSGLIGEGTLKVMKRLQDAADLEINEQWKEIVSVVEVVAQVVTKKLHTLAMEHANLLQQLLHVKHIFLMGRGELFHEFANQIENNSSVSDFNVLLQSCARKVLLNEEMLESFSLDVDGNGVTNIHYLPPWPLQLVFTAPVLRMYNHIFHFLFRLKKIQIKLNKAWLMDKCNRKQTVGEKRRQLRQNVWFLINNLQYYLQVDVLDSQFVTLETSIKSSYNFNEIRKSHTRFLSNLTLQCFLDNPQEKGTDIMNPVQQRLNNMLRLSEEISEMPSESNDSVVDSLAMQFEACYQKLFSLLAAVNSHGSHLSSQHLGQLLLRLDFNRYLSSKMSMIDSYH